MLRITILTLVLAAGTAAARDMQPETFVIRAGQDGRDAIVKIPVGAVSAFSADRAVALTDYVDPKVEAMRLSGDVRIHVIGTRAPLQIRADRIVLELTADAVPADGGTVRAQAGQRVQSARVFVDEDQTQTFVGHVVFREQTSSGALEIKAERLERRARPFSGV